ncbi:MAG TPA: nucleoside triphosphate pyrophosphohydrolase [Candidatus Eremiobacteraeota bacterium]|nr:nucleoside triphosphate pyrophosphohydrolase [Candidatus Eremiobacteraeota bacterium]
MLKDRDKCSEQEIIYLSTANTAFKEKILHLCAKEHMEVCFLEDIYSIYELKSIIKRLRGKEGCPWDKEQNHQTLIPYLTEETYEVVNAIEEKDYLRICEELGDLLLQIVFHCQIGEEENHFTLEDVARNIVKKLIRRHPHIFSNVNISNSEEVVKNWEEIKKKEKGKSDESILDGVPENLSALVRADFLGKKVARVGFDWPCAEDIIKKLREEICELEGAIKEKKPCHIREELGDILFTIVNISRHFGIDPEYALRNTSKKFVRRFKKIEELCRENGRGLKERTLEELDALWEIAKEEEKSET